jgi:cytochrome P450
LHCRKQLLNQIEQIIRQRQQSGDLGQDALGLLLQARDEQGNRLSLEERFAFNWNYAFIKRRITSDI